MRLLHETLIRERIAELISKNHNPDKLSFYLKTSRIWQNNEKSKIRLKNLIDEAEKSGVNKTALQKVREFLDNSKIDEERWNTSQEGLAIFSSEEDFETVIVPKEFDNKWYSGTHFNVKPLAPFIEMNLNYYVLLLSKNTVRAFRGQNRKLEELNVDRVPKNIEEMLWMDDWEKSIQHETGKAYGPGSRGGNIYHGHGDFSTVKKENLRRYINYLDDYLEEILTEKDLPLILVTTEPNFSLFMEISRYPKILSDFVNKNPDLINEQEMKDEVWDLIEKVHINEKKKFFKRFKDNLGTDQTTVDVPLIVSSAYFQRVDTLFVDPSVDAWGNFDEKNNSVEINENNNGGSVELINFSIVHTLKNGGRIFDVENKRFENKSPMGAILRF